MSILSKTVTALFFVAAIGASHDARADAVGANWTSSGPTTAEGCLAGNEMSMTGLLSQPNLATHDLSGPEYSAAPLSSDEDTLIYPYGSLWTVTFDSPVQNLLLYARSWRGTTGTGIDPEYTFDQPFTILSGFPNATVNGNTLTIPDGSFERGILLFPGAISSVGVIDVNFTGGFSQQTLTFGQFGEPICPADINGDCDVNVSDLLAVLLAWGECADCSADITGDGLANVQDLVEVLAAWGPC